MNSRRGLRPHWWDGAVQNVAQPSEWNNTVTAHGHCGAPQGSCSASSPAPQGHNLHQQANPAGASCWYSVLKWRRIANIICSMRRTERITGQSSSDKHIKTLAVVLQECSLDSFMITNDRNLPAQITFSICNEPGKWYLREKNIKKFSSANRAAIAWVEQHKPQHATIQPAGSAKLTSSLQKHKESP